MKYNAQTACETFSYSEDRKYWWSNSRVYNKFADGLGDENNIFEYTMSPNPTDFLNIKWQIIGATLHFNFLGQKNRDWGKYLKMQLM
jgi:hypothetical protein